MNKYLVVWSYGASQLFKERTPVNVHDAESARIIMENIFDTLHKLEGNKRDKVIFEVYKL